MLYDNSLNGWRNIFQRIQMLANRPITTTSVQETTTDEPITLDYEVVEEPVQKDNPLKTRLLQLIENSKGLKYIYGKKGFRQDGSRLIGSGDCSGFVKSLLAGVGINIKDGSINQHNATTKVNVQDAKAGDLIFLKGTNSSRGKNAVSHVGIVMGAPDENGNIQVAEAASKGTRIHTWNIGDEGFYKNHFDSIRRIEGDPFVDIAMAKHGGSLRRVELAKSGIHINPKNKGKFTATKEKTGKTTEELTHSKNPITRKRAIFAQNAAKWNK